MSRHAPRYAGLLAVALLAPRAASGQTVEEAQQAKLLELRKQVAGEVQLAAYDLVDEMVYGWTQSPLFDTPTPVVLAGVTVPVGLGTGLQGLVENHLTHVVIENPSTNVVLSHCPACTAVVVRSGKEGTVVSRGVDDPKVLARVSDRATRYALFVDVEAEGRWLVLRGRITRLDDGLSIVWARTLSSAASAPSMLRRAEDLKSADAARDELTDALDDRWPLNVPFKLGVRLFQGGGGTPVNPPPFLWIQSGVELALTQARAWTASVMLAYGYVPSSFDGFMGQIRVNRLLTGTARSFVSPDLYAFAGVAIFATSGPSAQIFAGDQPSTEDVLALAEGNDPTQVFAAVHTGVELRIGNRLGAALFFEALPTYPDSLGTFLGVFHGVGAEISVWF